MKKAVYSIASLTLLSLFSLTSIAGTLIYKNEFDGGFGDVIFNTKCRDSQYTIIGDPSNIQNKVAKLFQPGKQGCFEEWDNVFRKRTYMLLGPHADMRGAIPSVNYSGIRIVNGQHFWIGFRFLIDPSSPDGSDRTFLLGANVGEPALLIKGNDTLNVMPERYRTFSNGNWGPLVEKYVSDHPLIKGQWNSVVVHWYRRYDYQKDGIYQVWLNDKQVVDLHDIITGSDRIAAGGEDTTIQVGLYFGTADRSGDYTALVDDIKVAHGLDGFNLVTTSASLTKPSSPSGFNVE